MKRPERDPSVEHAVDKAHDCLLVIVCRERGGQPHSKSPRCGKPGLSCDIRVSSEDVLHPGTVDQEVVQIGASDGKLSFCDHFGADLKLYVLRMIYEDAIAFARYIKWNVLVTLLRAGAAVRVPDLHALTVFDKRGEPLAETVDLLVDADAKLLAHVSVVVVSPVVSHSAPGRLHQGEILCPGLRDQPAVSRVAHVPVGLADLEGEGTAVDDDAFLVLVHPERSGSSVELKRRAGADCAKVMVSLYTDDFVHRSCDDQRQIDAAERVASVVDACCWGADRHLVRLNFCKVCLLWCEAFTAFLLEPAAVTEFHHYLFSAPVRYRSVSLRYENTAPGTVQMSDIYMYHTIYCRKGNEIIRFF